MDHSIVDFEDVNPHRWDEWAKKIPESTYLHSSMWLQFCHSLMDSSQIHSFVILDSNKEPLAICPLGISTVNLEDLKFTEASWNGTPLAVPAIQSNYPTQRRRIARDIYEIFHKKIQSLQVDRSVMRRHAISREMMSGDCRPINLFEPLSAHYLPQVQNTLILDLTQDEEILYKSMSRKHRHAIKSCEKKGIAIKKFIGRGEDIETAFREYQYQHQRSAGRITRSPKSFECMLDLIRTHQASLFVAYAQSTPISYLICGEFEQFAFSWSQVNMDEYEKEFSPRHLLEWTAALDFKQRDFCYYEIGPRWFGPQIEKIPTQKELSIVFYGERCGAELWPQILFERYFNPDLFNRQYENRIHSFNQSDYFMTALTHC